MSQIDKVSVKPSVSIIEAIGQLNEYGMQIILITDDTGKLVGTLTDGDIRRALLEHRNLDEPVTTIMQTRFKFLYETERGRALSFMRKHMIRAVPLVDENMVLKEVLLWRNLTDNKDTHNYRTKDNQIFILAGGKGTRLAPFTNILPKPLIPLGEVPIIEIIMLRFQEYGFNNFVLSVNYKADMIKLYFAENPEKFNIDYVQEEKFSGTAGSLSLIKGQPTDSVIVCNCDVLIDIDFDDFLSHHKEKGYDATIVGVIRQTKIPYGVIDMKDGIVVDMKEKPEYNFVVNAGIYVLEPKVINMIEDDEWVDMPDLLKKAQDAGLKVGVYPISTEMIDVGHWDEYKQAVEKLRQMGIIGAQE